MKLSKYEKSVLKELRHNVCIARDGYKCLKCNEKNKPLYASHIYSVGAHKKMEWDIDNVKSLCYQCHILWWHRNPIEANEWLEKNIDKARLDRLKLRSQVIDKTPIDYKLIKIELEQLL